jgi:hypothetical protein
MDIGLLETRERLTESALRGLEDLVESLFEHPRMISDTMAEIPVIGEPGFIVALDHSFLLPPICAAMITKEKFRMECPDWPDLPLRQKDIDEMKNADCPRCSVVGFYGDSLRGEDWSPQHPSFGRYTSGLLFCRHAPKELRNNRELLEKFPPCRLEGMTGGRLTWRGPEALALDRKARRMIKEHESRMGA